MHYHPGHIESAGHTQLFVERERGGGWAGAPLAPVLQAAGIRPGAAEIEFAGAECKKTYWESLGWVTRRVRTV
jgi:DMSO/TMAO reductase YedYZ molybdopterin-dependent catalytic subunit